MNELWYCRAPTTTPKPEPKVLLEDEAKEGYDYPVPEKQLAYPNSLK